MGHKITASMLYDLVTCPHRVYRDVFDSLEDRDAVSAFAQLLWERGNCFERETIEKLQLPFLDLSDVTDADDRMRQTIDAMGNDVELIYHGRISHDRLLGEPDLLRFQDGGYVAGDIKSGAGLEGSSDDDKKPKKEYAVQLGLYTDILERLDMSSGRIPFIWDVHGDEVQYLLDDPQGVRNTETWWEFYELKRDEAIAITDAVMTTTPAAISKCKECHWYSSCMKWLKENNDLTLIPMLGRTKRDAMVNVVATVADFANADLKDLPKFKGIATALPKFHTRAILLTEDDAKPFTRDLLQFPDQQLELFFDIEVDPLRDLVYLHGFIERTGKDNQSEVFVPFVAREATQDAEQKAFAEAWEYLKEKAPFAMYYYSKYERTNWRNLQKRYPDVVSAKEVEELFNPKKSVDLYYDVVLKSTEWPTYDHSIKTLAKYLGFKWRDIDPSGAASIEWYHRWIDQGDEDLWQRILDYNEDDCRATRVLLDGLRQLPLRQ